MPLKMPSTDKKILIGVASFFVLVCAVLAFFQPQDDNEEPFPSTYSVRSGGAKATFLLLNKMGFKAERWGRAPIDLPKDGHGIVLVLAGPLHWPDQSDRVLVGKFLQSGGTVLAAGGRASGFLPHAFGNWVPKGSWTTYKALGPSVITRATPQITMRGAGSWGGDEAVTPLYGTATDMVAVTYQVGNGRVIWLSSASPLTNAGLKGPGNAKFLAAALSSVGAQRVLWDLYFTEAKRDEVSTFSTPPLMWGGAQLLLVFALAIWTYSRRFGPVRPMAKVSRLSPVEFVDVLGNLYRQRKAANVAVDVLYRRFRNLASRKLALPANATPDHVARAAHSRVSATEEQMAEVLNTCESARYGAQMKAIDALHLCDEMNDYMRKLHLITEEKE